MTHGRVPPPGDQAPVVALPCPQPNLGNALYGSKAEGIAYRHVRGRSEAPARTSRSGSEAFQNRPLHMDAPIRVVQNP
jgi:hypothetical protein